MPSSHAVDIRSSGGRLVSVDGKALPLRSVTIDAQAAGGLARVTLRQSFQNRFDQALNVIYTVPLPADAAVSGYRMRLGDRIVNGEIDLRLAAHRRFDEAILEGRTASLLEQERGGVFTQRLGNVPAGADVDTELVLDQRLAWMAGGEGGWEWRFPTVVAPRYLGAEGRVRDREAITVEVADTPTGVQADLRLTIGDDLAGRVGPESPSHPIRCDGHVVTLEGDGARLDRDVAVRWAVAGSQLGMSLRRARPGKDRPHGAHAYGLLAIVPPAATEDALPRDLIILLDTSGSMSGRPLEAARRVVGALVDSLSERDQLEMVAFASQPRRWRDAPVAVDEEIRRQARRWVEGLQAGGATEMASGLQEALRPMRRDAQRQVVLVTDGLIGFESEIVAMLRDRLPQGSRLHSVGIGPAVNRDLTGPAARAGRGAEVIVDLNESAERAAERVVAATRRPILVDLAVEGDAVAGHAPRRLPDVMSGSPCLIALRLDPCGGDLVVTARGPAGAWRESLRVAPTDPGEGSDAIVKLYGRETVGDLELDAAAGADRGEIDRAVERLGLQFGIATRLTSWVAVSDEKSVDPRQPVRVTRIPQELPFGMSAEGLGLRAASSLGEMEDSYMSFAVPPASMAWARASLRRDVVSHEPRLTGRWLLPRKDGLLVLEVTVVEGSIAWVPGGLAILRSSDGGLAEASIEPDRSTRQCAVTKGQIFRVALKPAEDIVGTVGLVVLSIEGELLEVLVK